VREGEVREEAYNRCEKQLNADWFAISHRKWQRKGARCDASEVMGSDYLPFDCDVVEVVVDE
jgi:hypothetical protein